MNSRQSQFPSESSKSHPPRKPVSSLSADMEGWGRFISVLTERERVKLMVAIRRSFTDCLADKQDYGR